jgi:hypothetical protein
MLWERGDVSATERMMSGTAARMSREEMLAEGAVEEGSRGRPEAKGGGAWMRVERLREADSGEGAAMMALTTATPSRVLVGAADW